MKTTNGPRLIGRETSVPHILLIPDIGSSLLLKIASDRLLAIAQTAPASNDRSIVGMVDNHRRDRQLVRADFPKLFDELSIYSYTDQQTNLAVLSQKALMEFRALQKIEKQGLGNALRDDDAFLDLLFRLHRSVKGGGTRIRRGDMFIRPDDGGNLIVFPPWQLCDSLLRSLAGIFREHLSADPALCAVIAYAGVIHAHPFRDANGRTARALFNLLLRHVSGTKHYLPISTVAAVSEGGFLIKLRRALYGGEWESLTKFFVDAMSFSVQSQEIQ